MNKDWNYAHMWDTMRRALEDSAIKGLEVRPLDVLSDMNTLEELEERRRQKRKEREKKIEFYADGRIEFCATEEGAEECE